MCLAIPMQVESMLESTAICRDGEGRAHHIDTLLTGPVDKGQWVLCYLGAAREVVDADRAAQIQRAIAAVAALDPSREGNGRSIPSTADSIDIIVRAAFSDLIDREPELPEFFRSGTTSVMQAKPAEIRNSLSSEAT